MDENRWFIDVEVMNPPADKHASLIALLEGESSRRATRWRWCHETAQKVIAQFESGVEFYSGSITGEPDMDYLCEGTIEGMRVQVRVSSVPF